MIACVWQSNCMLKSTSASIYEYPGLFFNLLGCFVVLMDFLFEGEQFLFFEDVLVFLCLVIEQAVRIFLPNFGFHEYTTINKQIQRLDLSSCSFGFAGFLASCLTLVFVLLFTHWR